MNELSEITAHVAHEVTISLPLNQLDRRHSLFDHRHLRSWFQVLQRKPFP